MPSTNPSDTPSGAPSDVPTDTPTDTPSDAPTTLGKIVSAEAVATNKIAVTFDSAVAEDTKLDVTYLGGDITGTIAIDGSTIIFTAANDFVEGEYAVAARLGEEKTEPVSVSVKERAISEIKIKGDTALTETITNPSNSDDKTYNAYVYYEVLDQYGIECGDIVNLTWSGGPGEVTWDSSKNKITVTDKKTYFMPGSTISLTAVSVGTKNAYSQSFTVTVGQDQQLNSVEIAGFMDTYNKGTVLEQLPANFAKDRYVMLYTVQDQNGNNLDVAANNDKLPIADQKVTFISTTPMVVESTISDYDIVTDKNGKDYFAAKLTPGMYADKGGNFTIKYIANRTGNQDEKTFTLGTNGYLTKLELKQPSSYVTDGEGADLDYVATIKNAEGETTTKDYETIVRSSNTLNLSASVGTLKVYEKDNGEAGIRWDDDAAYAADNFIQSSSYDGQDRPITLTTVVVGGEASTLQLSVKDTRRPAAIKSVSLSNGDDNIMVEGNNNVKATLAGSNGWSYERLNGEADDTIVFVDQYGREFDQKTIWNAFKFFQTASTEGFNNEYYSIRAKSDATRHLLSSDSKYLVFNSDNVDHWKHYFSINFDGVKCDTIKVDGVTKSKLTTDTIKYSIVKKSDKDAIWGTTDANEKTVGKELTVEYTIVPKTTAIANASIKDISLQQIETNNSANPNGNGLDMSSTGTATKPGDAAGDLSIKNGAKVALVSKYNGKSFVLPNGIVTYTEAPAGASASGSAISLKADGALDKVLDGRLLWSDLYVNDGYSFPRQNAAVTLELEVKETEAATSGAIVEKEITVSDAASYLASLYVERDDNAPRNTNLGVAWTVKEGKEDKVYNNPLFKSIKGYDQYGNDYNNFTYKATVTLTAEADTLLQHLDKSFTIENNGKAEPPVIKGAEIGDTYKLTVVATDKTSKNVKVTSDLDLTVKADTSAFISDKNDSDKTFRKDVLKMYR